MDYYDFETNDYVEYDIPGPGQPCVFDSEHTACELDLDGYFWCSTAGPEEGDWGLCEPDCPKAISFRSPPTFELRLKEIVVKN